MWTVCGAQRADHPHAGGENDIGTGFALGANGPSPRGWGEQPSRSAPLSIRRTIPTRVGRTRRKRASAISTTDHPHAGGENGAAAIPGTRARGPSPRGWGERRRVGRLGELNRTIPTRVGRTQTNGTSTRPRADHPHTGGENFGLGRRVRSPCGPSPRGWGERLDQNFRDCQLRTIPTRVGRTAAGTGGIKLTADHPHAGGENMPSLIAEGVRYGPSPRGWGEHVRHRSRGSSERTIPTRVGRTRYATKRKARRTDHPHAGGENRCPFRSTLRLSGPSPRGWGEPRRRR